jgi:photosystem II stability/assembly factor-like uncharacterized protein
MTSDRTHGPSPITGAHALAITCALAFLTSALSAQQGTKGIWEPVNYKGDIQFFDVAFVTPDVGWAAGGSTGTSGGVILFTNDGGQSWSVQFGDPESSDGPITSLFFLDGEHGWATRGVQLLRTTDGQTWEQAGTIAPYRGEWRFVSPQVGFVVEGPAILRTTDGGQRWSTVATCATQVEINGLTQKVGCHLKAIDFPTRDVGYAVGEGPGDYVFMMKTEDGGETWTTSAPPAPGAGSANEVSFTDERTGFLRVYGGDVFHTDDGGVSWRPSGTKLGPQIKFADPEVGWSMAYRYLGYTTNGGRTWTSREIAFPAFVSAFSLPRRDRGYAVGPHGMIYRYRTIPASEPVPPKAIISPAMPAFASELDDEVADAGKELDQLKEELSEAAQQASADTSAKPVADDSTAFVEACCAKSVNELQATVDALTPLVPRFFAKYRNVNLIIAGLQFLGLLPDHLAAVKVALHNLRGAKGAVAASAALAEVAAAIDSLRRTTRYAFQQEAPVLDARAARVDGSAPGRVPARLRPTSDVPKDGAAKSSGDTTGVEQKAKKAVQDEAKKQLQDAKKKIKQRIP